MPTTNRQAESKVKEPLQDDAPNDIIDLINEEVDLQNVRRKYVITVKGKETVFKGSVVELPLFGRMEKFFKIQIHPDHPKFFKVDDDNLILVGLLGKDVELFATLFEGEKDGKRYLGIELKMKDGYKFQHKIIDRKGKVTHGFWFSSGERKALSIMGYLNLVAA